jgi:peroxiredoxin
MSTLNLQRKTLKQRFAQLQAEREISWAPEQLAKNAGQRATLVERFDPASVAQIGDVLPDATLVDQDGAAHKLSELTTDGPAVLVFFRFAGCPACNIALPYYDETLAAPLKAAGIRLLAVSAQNPVDRSIIDRHDLSYPVTADPDYALARALGITFFPDEQPAVAPGQPWIGATLGTQSYEIDQPAVLIVQPDLSVRRLWVSPDWLDRTDAGDILAELGLGASQAPFEQHSQ